MGRARPRPRARRRQKHRRRRAVVGAEERMTPNVTAPASAPRSPVPPGVRRPRGDRRLPPRTPARLVPARHPLVLPEPRPRLLSSTKSCAAPSPTCCSRCAARPRRRGSGSNLLFEHQSQPDRWMALRLLRYCCRIWEADRPRLPRRAVPAAGAAAGVLPGRAPLALRHRTGRVLPPGAARPALGAALLPAAAGPDPDGAGGRWRYNRKLWMG